MLHPDSKQSGLLPGSFPLFLQPAPFLFFAFPRLSLFHCPPHSLPVIFPNRAFADRRMQFPVCWIISHPRSGSDPCKFCTNRVSHCFWQTYVTEPPTANDSVQSEHLAALYDLNFQLFGGSELCHQPQTGSGEPVGCQFNPTLRLKTQPQPLAFQPSKCLRIWTQCLSCLCVSRSIVFLDIFGFKLQIAVLQNGGKTLWNKPQAITGQ